MYLLIIHGKMNRKPELTDQLSIYCEERNLFATTVINFFYRKYFKRKIS